MVEVRAINTFAEFDKYVDEIRSRAGQHLPKAFGIGAVKLDDAGEVAQAYFPKVNTGGAGPGAAAVFADIACYRSGNAVYKLHPSDFIALTHAFLPYMENPQDHPNVAATVEIQNLTTSPSPWTPVIVFVGDFDNDQCRGRPIYEEFMKALCLSRAT